MPSSEKTVCLIVCAAISVHFRHFAFSLSFDLSTLCKHFFFYFVVFISSITVLNYVQLYIHLNVIVLNAI